MVFAATSLWVHVGTVQGFSGPDPAASREQEMFGPRAETLILGCLLAEACVAAVLR